MQPSRAVLLGSVALVAGCYSYVPARVDLVEPGSAVRLRLSAEEAERLEPMRLTLARQLDAVVLARSNGELLVETQVGSLDPQRGTRALAQRINVPFSEIHEVEFRRRDDLKTGLAVGALAAAVGVVVAAALDGGEGGPREPIDPITELRTRRYFLGFAFPF